jgi:hypothetical protein
MRYLIPFFLLILSASAYAQKVGGSWYGKAEIMMEGQSHSYLTELILKQKKSNDVEGIMGYYFKNQYQSFFVKGKFNPKTRLLVIKDVPIVFFRSNESKPSVNCTMDFEATLTASKAKSNLKGYFHRNPNYKYTCPDLNLLFTLDTQEKTDSILKEAVAVQRVWRPNPEEVVMTPELVTEKKLSAPPEVVVFEKRKIAVNNEIVVKSDSLRITFYDNGDVDGDIISVFYNKVPVLQKQNLSVQGVNLYLKLDSSTSIHDISMFAENLGRIPPNTALMIIHDGINRYEVFLTSTLETNGTVRIRRQ